MSESIKKKDTAELTTTDIKIEVGQIYTDRRGEGIFRISEIITEDKYTQYHYEVAVCLDPLEWKLATFEYSTSKGVRHPSKRSVDELKKSYTLMPKELFDRAQRNFKAFIERGDLSAYQLDQSASAVGGTEIVAMGGSAQLQNMHDGLEKQRQEMQALDMLAKTHIANLNNKLEQFRRGLNSQLEVFKKQMTRIMRVIQTIELYLGIEEDLFQIQSGMPAAASEPISFRQQILYIDEEVGVWTDGGYDYTNIPDFEEWLIKDKNYEKLLPEIKGILLFKPRRKDKDYGGNYYENKADNEPNRESYFLIRNGENLYRIYSEKILIPDRLFPLREELAEMFTELSDMMNSKEHVWERDKQEKEDKVENMTFRYKKMAFLLQGLIDRTQIFHPLPETKINVFNLEDNQDAVNFIYDDEVSLPNGKLPFWEWHKEINSTITHGSRILNTERYSPNGSYIPRKDFSDRLYYTCNDYNIPQLPSMGIYEVYDKKSTHWNWQNEKSYQDILASGIEHKVIKVDETRYNGEWDSTALKYTKSRKGYKVEFTKHSICIMYNAGGKTTHGWGDYGDHDRKNRISWKIFKEDKFILNYDRIDLADIDFYINSRYDRQQYLFMLPMLFQMKKQMLDEQAQERAFIDFLVGRASANNPKIDEEKCREFVNGCISWWKNRVIMKRPITKNDTLALRMIERRVNAKKNKKVLEQDKE